MEFPEDYISCEPSPLGMFPCQEQKPAPTSGMVNPYKKPFQRLEFRKVDIEA